MIYRIGSFNLKRFGRNALYNKAVEKIATLILDNDLDIVAIQEVYSDGKAIQNEFIDRNNNDLKQPLLNYLNKNQWGFVHEKIFSSQYSTDEEQIAFLYKKQKFELIGEEDDRINRFKRFDMHKYPYYARFKFLGGPFAELRLICIHTFASDRRIVQQELDTIMNKIYPMVADKGYGNNLKSYTIILGDYNASIKCTDFNEYEGNPIAYIEEQITVDDKCIITKQKKPTSLKNMERYIENANYYDNNSNWLTFDYDHFSADKTVLDDIVVSVDRIEAVKELYHEHSKIQNYYDYYNEISDHLPIVMEIDFKGNTLLDGRLPWKKKK